MDIPILPYWPILPLDIFMIVYPSLYTPFNSQMPQVRGICASGFDGNGRKPRLTGEVISRFGTATFFFVVRSGRKSPSSPYPIGRCADRGAIKPSVAVGKSAIKPSVAGMDLF